MEFASVWFVEIFLPATLIFVAMIAVNFIAGIWMEILEEKNFRKAVFITATAINVLILVVFKALGSHVSMLTISFITFQAVSYLAGRLAELLR